MNKYKKWCFGVILSVIGILLPFGMINYIVDPYSHYRYTSYPKDYLETRMFQVQRQLTPGFAKHMDYDTVLVGSSMTEYFSADYINNNMKVKCAKLSISGGTTYEINSALTTAINTGKVKNALVSVDVYMYDRDIKYTNAPMASYLYDENWFNDFKYLLNKDIFLDDTIPLLEERLSAKKDTFVWNDLYDDSESCIFSKEGTMKHYEPPTNSDKKEERELFTKDDIAEELKSDARISNMKANFNENLLKVIDENPDIKFTLFFPPNSILYWDNSTRTDEVRNQAAFKTYIYETLSKYSNVVMYDFQDVEEIIYNLDNYKDRSHYGPKLCNYLVDCMVNGKNQLTKDNYITKAVHLVNEAESFSLEQIE